MKERFRHSISSDNMLMLSLLGIAAVLRFWDYSNLPFMHDELSALMRADAPSFGQLITRARETDVHPIGVHLFLYFWQGFVGTAEIVVKLPFILMSIASVYLTYRIGSSWFSTTTGLLSAAFMACLQFTVMYGQLARPYASGLFFTLWFVSCWSRYLFSPSHEWLKVGGFILSATLACYNHYFSLLFVAIVGACGFFLLRKGRIMKYIYACITIIILFLPHIPITLEQLSAGQDQSEWWISRPDPSWIIHFLEYLFHFSIAEYILVVLLIALGFVWYNKTKTWYDKKRILCLLFFITPFLVIYFYSVSLSPVLQLSSMMFGMPFLLLFIFSFYGETPLFIKTAMLFAIIILSMYTLIRKREHFHVFYKQPYEQMAIMSNKVIAEKGPLNVSCALSIPEGFIDYYHEKHGDFDFFHVQDHDMKEFRKFVDQQPTDYFVAGNLPGEYLCFVQEKYPYRIRKMESFTTWVYCYAKDSTQGARDSAIYSQTLSAPGKGLWSGNLAKTEDPKGKELPYVAVDSSLEYGPTFSDSLMKMIDSGYDEIWLSADLGSNDTASNPSLVLDIRDGDSSLLWKSSSFKPFHPKKGKARIYMVAYLRDVKLRKGGKPICKVYVWNSRKEILRLYDMKIEARKGNKYIYGLYEPF
jgi:hypothetical protein